MSAGPSRRDDVSFEREPRRRGLVERYVDSVNSRVGGGSMVSKVLHKVFPNHFSFLWGELALYSFVVIVVTGIYLTLFFEGSQEEVVYRGSYEPLQGVEVSAAYESVLRISFDVKGGLLIRQMHHWAALIFVGAVSLHMARVFFTGAFRRPRELNWVVGVLLLILALAAGFTGYSLPDDLLSGTRAAHHPRHHPRHPVHRRTCDVPAVRRRVAGHRHHRSPLPHPHPAHPGAHRSRARAFTWHSCGGRSTPSSTVQGAPSTTWSASGCGHRSR